jgi:hypothetical protein
MHVRNHYTSGGNSQHHIIFEVGSHQSFVQHCLADTFQNSHVFVKGGRTSIVDSRPIHCRTAIDLRKIRFQARTFCYFKPFCSFAALITFCKRAITVIGPVPPGIGVIALATLRTLSKSTSPLIIPCRPPRGG